MDCAACEGACCEAFYVSPLAIRIQGDHRRWLELHATPEPRGLMFECRCTALTPAGRCGIYEDRPEMCREYEPGGDDCLETVRQRRTREQYARIRGPQDPEQIHEAAA